MHSVLENIERCFFGDIVLAVKTCQVGWNGRCVYVQELILPTQKWPVLLVMCLHGGLMQTFMEWFDVMMVKDSSDLGAVRNPLYSVGHINSSNGACPVEDRYPIMFGCREGWMIQHLQSPWLHWNMGGYFNGCDIELMSYSPWTSTGLRDHHQDWRIQKWRSCCCQARCKGCP